MSSTEPPAGSVPEGESTPPPPPPPPAAPSAGTPPPPPAANYGTPAPPPPAPAAPASGVGAPGNLTDRFLARLVDYIIVGIPVAILQFIFQAATSYWTGLFIGGVVGAVLYTGYFGYLESSRGQTVGKSIMKLKVVAPDGQSNPTMNDAVKRNIYNVFGVVPCIGSLAQLAAIIMVAIGINSDPQRQHFFDKFAGGTKVIKVG